VVQPGVACVAMILNGLGFTNRRLYLMPQFFESKSMSALFEEEINASDLNEQVLSQIFPKRKAELFWTSLCRESMELFKNSLLSRLDMLSFSQHMMQFNTRQCCISKVKGFEPLHWFGDFFDKAMVLFHNIVEVFDLPDVNL
jgi:transposase